MKNLTISILASILFCQFLEAGAVFVLFFSFLFWFYLTNIEEELKKAKE